jgi:anti-sigma B factor antagonist
MAELEAEPPTVRVEVEVHADPTGVQIVALSGELDCSNAESLQERLGSMPPQPAQPLIFDLTGLRFMDSAGIAVLISATNRASGVSLRNPSPVIRRVLEATGLSDLFSIEP